MLNVIFKLIVTQPKLLLTHVANYAELLVEELQYAFTTWKFLLLLYVLSGACLGLAVTTAAGAVLLWSALPLVNPQTAWVLVVLPLTLLVASVLFYLVAKRYRAAPCFAGVQEQLKLDMLALCQDQTL